HREYKLGPLCRERLPSRTDVSAKRPNRCQTLNFVKRKACRECDLLSPAARPLTGRSPPEKAIRSGWASARQATGFGPCADCNAAPAWSIAAQSEARHAARSPPP